jgi:hypothetical protein
LPRLPCGQSGPSRCLRVEGTSPTKRGSRPRRLGGVLRSWLEGSQRIGLRSLAPGSRPSTCRTAAGTHLLGADTTEPCHACTSQRSCRDMACFLQSMATVCLRQLSPEKAQKWCGRGDVLRSWLEGLSHRGLATGQLAAHLQNCNGDSLSRWYTM